jgi:putative flippase GtrA
MKNKRYTYNEKTKRMEEVKWLPKSYFKTQLLVCLVVLALVFVVTKAAPAINYLMRNSPY